MQTKKSILISVLLLLFDFVSIIAVLHISYIIRYGVSIPELNFEPFKSNFLALAFVYALAFSFTGMFQCRFRSHWEVFKKVFHGMIIGMLFSFVFLYVFREKWSTFPSSIFAIAVPVGSILLATVKICFLRVVKRLKTRVVIVGKCKSDEVFINRLRIEVFYVKNIEEILQYENIDEIVICDHVLNDSQLNLLVYLLSRLKVKVNFTPSLYAKLLSGNINQKNKLRFLATTLGNKSDHEEYLINLLDVVGSLMVLVLTIPIWIVVAITIKLVSSGPVFYKQKRVGKDGEIFSLYKFRTMIVDAEVNTGPVLASQQDSRIIPFGSFIRKTRIDELPQLLNVLSGKMSLVGPRPERLYFLERHIALRGIRLAVKPGLTGLAQIRNVYALHPKHKVKYDYLYIQRRSFLLNLYILIQTIPVVLSKTGV